MWFQDMVPLICCHHTMITTNIRRADTDEGKDKSDCGITNTRGEEKIFSADMGRGTQTASEKQF